MIDVLIELPGVRTVDCVLHLGLFFEQGVVVRVRLGERSRDLVEAVEHVAQRANAILDVAAHVACGIEPGLLLEQPHAGSRSKLSHPGRRLLLAGHDPENGRLAGPVWAEDADLRAREER